MYYIYISLLSQSLSFVFPVTATEVKTSSTLITPSPTWNTITVTHTASPASPPTPHNKPQLGVLRANPVLPSIWPKVEQVRQVDPRTGLEHADVLEIDQGTSQTAAKNKLDRLKQAYGIFFANSAQRSAQRFNNFGRGTVAPPPPVENPLFVPSGGKSGTRGSQGDLDYDYIEEFDQQGLATQERPVFVPGTKSRGRKIGPGRPVPATVEKNTNKSRRRNPQTPRRVVHKPQSAAKVQPIVTPSTKVFTLFFSGRVPGEYTTRLTTLNVDSEGQPLRNKRSADIEPSRVIPPIMKTEPPSSSSLLTNQLEDQWEQAEDSQKRRRDDSCSEIYLDLESSLKTTVTVTQVVTVTETVSKSK